MFCQVCGASNPEEQEYCGSCSQRLLVLSGPFAREDVVLEEGTTEEGFSLDEHLLERISILEEAVKRTAETVRQLLTAVHKQERNVLVNQSGLATLRDILERKRIVSQDEWGDLWRSRMDYQLLALEKRERFVELKDRIAGRFSGEKQEVFEDLLTDAEQAFLSLDVERALDALRTAFDLDGDNYELGLFIGETLFNDGEPDEALHYFTQALRMRSDLFEGLVFSGVILHERGESARAEELLKRAVSVYPDSFLPNFSLGAIYASRGQLALAVTFLKNAIQFEKVPEAFYLMGSCLYEMGRLTPAIKYLEETVRHDPSFDEAHHLLGLAYLDRHWNRKALESFRQAERLNPNRLRYQDLVGYLSGKENAPLPQVGEEAGSWVAQAEEYLATETPERALRCYRRAVESEPENPALLMSYALVCLQLDRSREAEDVTRRVLSLDPSEMLRATAYATLIEALRSEGRFREGNKFGLRLLDEGKTNFAKTIAYYEMAYNLAEMEEDLDQALDYARRSLQTSPDELKQFPLAALGWVHFKREEFEDAIDFLYRSSEVGPSQKTLTHLGMALLAAGDEERARGVLADARDIRGESIEQKLMECMKDSGRLMEKVRGLQQPS